MCIICVFSDKVWRLGEPGVAGCTRGCRQCPRLCNTREYYVLIG